MLTSNIYSNQNPINYHLNIKQHPIAYHHLHKYYILSPQHQLTFMPSIDNNNNNIKYTNKKSSSNQQQSQKLANVNNQQNIYSSKLQPLKNVTKVKDLIAKHNSQNKEEKPQTVEIETKRQEKKLNTFNEQNEYSYLKPAENPKLESKLIQPKIIIDKQRASSPHAKNGSVKNVSSIIESEKNRVPNPDPSTKPSLQTPRIHVYSGNNKKPRFKTMHIEPSVVREAATKIEATKTNFKTTQNSLTKVNLVEIKHASTNDSDYSTLATDSKKEDNSSNKNKSDTINDYLIAEKEIKDFYNNLNQAIKSSNKTYDSSNSFKSSMNSFVSNFSNEKQQKLTVENNSLIINAKKLNDDEKNETCRNGEQLGLKNLKTNQAILSTSDYSSFNSQLSNNFTKLNTNLLERKLATPTITSAVITSTKNPSPPPLQTKPNPINETNKQNLKALDNNNKNFNESDYRKYFDNLVSNKDAAVRGRNRTGHIVHPVSFKSPVRMIRINYNNNGIKTRQSSNPPVASRIQDSKKQDNTNENPINRDIVFQQPNENNERKISLISTGINNTKKETTASNQDKLQNIMKLFPKDGKNIITKTKFVKLAENGMKVQQLPPPPPTLTPQVNVTLKDKKNDKLNEKSNDIGEILDLRTNKHISISPIKHDKLVLSTTELAKDNAPTNENFLNKDYKIIENEILETQQKTQTKQHEQPVERVATAKVTDVDHKEDLQFGDFKLPLSLIKNIEKNIMEKNIEKAFEQAKKSQELEQQQKQPVIDPNLVQQKIGTLYAPKRKQLNGVISHDYVKTVESVETFSTTEDNNTNSNNYMNKVNLPNIDGIDYYYRSKNDNKINISNYLNIPSHGSYSQTPYMNEFNNLLSGKPCNLQFKPLVQPIKTYDKSPSLPWMKAHGKSKNFYQNYMEENNKRKKEGNPFLMLLPGIAIPVDNDIIDSDDDTQHK